jgi:hypothetical protein
MARGWRKSSPKLTKNQPPSPTFLFSVVSLFFPLLSRTFSHQHSHHHLSHYNLLHNQTPNHLTWWLHHLSLSLLSAKLFFLYATTTPAAAASAETTSSKSFRPSQQQLGRRLSPQPLQPRASPLLWKPMLLPFPAATNASRRPHHLQSHHASPVRPPTPSTPSKPPSSLLLLLPPFSTATACK